MQTQSGTGKGRDRHTGKDRTGSDRGRDRQTEAEVKEETDEKAKTDQADTEARGRTRQ